MTLSEVKKPLPPPKKKERKKKNHIQPRVVIFARAEAVIDAYPGTDLVGKLSGSISKWKVGGSCISKSI